MATDLTKLVEEIYGVTKRIKSDSDLYRIILAMAAEIEANREEIGRLIDTLEKTLPAINEHMKEEIKKLKDKTNPAL